jgi:hypothetical protein
MTVIKTFQFILLITFFSSLMQFDATSQIKEYDIVIYGGTSAGIAAAIQASRMGNPVVLIEPANRIGGLTTGGLGQTDFGNKIIVGGISKEFYQGIKAHYENPDNWKWQQRSEFRNYGQPLSEKEDAMWFFEPSVALKVYETMIAKENIEMVYHQRLNRETGVKLKDGKIIEIEMESGQKYKGKMFIDATYEGDLMAAAKVSYTVGRESNEDYKETLNGIQANIIGMTLRRTVSLNGYNHNFVEEVDPYVIKGNPSSGLLPFIADGGRPGIDGRGDNGVQAYCFRMTLTDHPDNRIPFKKPDDYNELEYELLFRNYEAGYNRVPWLNQGMPNRKTDTNNRDGFSTDFIGQNHAYPEASYEEREKIIDRHRSYQQGLMWSLAYHPRIPEHIRNEVSQWGTCKDEYEREDGWQQQLYIREARRMMSDYIMTQHHCEGFEVAEDPVGLAAYGMDSHNVKRYVDANGFVKNEGNVEAHGFPPYPISYRSIIPKKGECSNLLVPVCLSSTHIAFGSIRMEPVFMILGQSAATAASLAIQKGADVHSLDYNELKSTLIHDKQNLSYKPE